MQSLTEIWEPIIDNAYYEVSNLGRIRSVDRTMPYKLGTFRSWKGKIISPSKSNSGYLQVTLYDGSNKKIKFIHRAIAESFLPIGENMSDVKINVNHKDGNKLNNHIDNLEWVTCSENIKHAINNGLIKRKVDKFDYLHIKLLLECGLKKAVIARGFNVQRAYISKISLGQV